MFSTVAVQLTFPTNSAQGFSFLHVLTNTCYFLVFLKIAIPAGVSSEQELLLFVDMGFSSRDFSCCTARLYGCAGFRTCSTQALEIRLSNCGMWP